MFEVMNNDFDNFVKNPGMIRHIVFFRMANEITQDQKMLLLEEIKLKLEELPHVIPEILSFEVGINCASDGKAADLSLLSDFAGEEALITYQLHPAHKAFVEWNRDKCPRYSVVDYKF